MATWPADASRDDRLAVLTRLSIDLSLIERAADKGAQVVASLRTYAAKDDPNELAPIDIGQELESALALLGDRKGRSVEIDKRFAPGLWAIGPKQGLIRAWVSIIANAFDAVDGKGRIEIGAAVDGESCVVSIRDDGPGIPDELREKIFDPFFTTKTHGKGLGLNSCRRMVEAAGGTVSFESRPGHTEFLVVLPRSAPPA